MNFSGTHGINKATEQKFRHFIVIGFVKISLLALSAVDRRFKPRSDQSIDYEINICCFSAKHQGVRAKTGWNGIGIVEQLVYPQTVVSL